VRTALAVFGNQFKEFRSDKMQLIFFFVWAVVTFAWPLISSMGFGEPDNWDYPRQIAPALGIAVAGGAMLLIFAPVVARHKENGYLLKTKPVSYFLGIGGFYAVLNMIMAVYIALVGALSGLAIVNYMLLLLLATICAMLIGAIIGILSKDDKTALYTSYPLGFAFVMLFKFRNGVPAFQMINPIRPFINWFYMERINYMLIEVLTGFNISDILVLLANIFVLSIAIVVLCKMVKNGIRTK
jgi:hypothetical protein